jgi:hypothetical protein
MSDLSVYANWHAAAKRSAEAALDIYESDTVEHELALHLSRALRELGKSRDPVDDALDSLVADGLLKETT